MEHRYAITEVRSVVFNPATTVPQVYNFGFVIPRTAFPIFNNIYSAAFVKKFLTFLKTTDFLRDKKLEKSSKMYVPSSCLVYSQYTYLVNNL